MKKSLVVAVALGLCGGAYADITEYLDLYQAAVAPGSDALHPDFNDGTYYTVDLRLVVDGDEAEWMWTSSHAEATIDAGIFFEHAVGGDGPPMAAFVAIYPALEYDSFYCAIEYDYGNQPPMKVPSGTDFDNQPQYRMATWFDVPPNEGCGDYLLARYTIHATSDELPVIFRVQGAHTTMGGGGYLYPYDLRLLVPEPTTPALLGLGLGLALIRRR